MTKHPVSRIALARPALLGVAMLMITAPLVALGASTKTVEVLDASYSPKTFSVQAGTKIVFKNTSGFPHTATADDGSFNTGMIPVGKSKSVTLKKSGSFAFHCQFHGAVGGVGQSGTITVTAASRTAAPEKDPAGTPPASDASPDLPGGTSALPVIGFAIAVIGSVLAALAVDLVRGVARRRPGD